MKKGVERGFKMTALSLEQNEILNYITKDFMTPSQIAKKRDTSLNAVYKTIQKLKKKGYLKGVEKGGLIRGGSYTVATPQRPASKLFRLHAQSFTIKIIEATTFYQKYLKKKNRDLLENNSILLYDDSIVIYYNKDFWGDSVDECLRLSLAFTDQFITKIENTFKVLLRTRSKCDIREFKGEIAKIDDPVAREFNLKKEKLRIYDEFGELRLIVDNSFKFDELETVHQKHYSTDMKSIESKWLDLIKTDFKLSEAEKHIKSLQLGDHMIQDKLQYIVELVGNMSILQNNLMELLQRREK